MGVSRSTEFSFVGNVGSFAAAVSVISDSMAEKDTYALLVRRADRPGVAAWPESGIRAVDHKPMHVASTLNSHDHMIVIAASISVD